jgi:phenylalanyl-tRNA synthetase beta chain
MRFSFEWLKSLSSFRSTAQDMAELISAHVCEAEVSPGRSFENIIVARVEKTEKHPNADRLRVVALSDGKNHYYPVVCGAWNFEAGDLVPLALPGAVIPHNQHDAEGKPFILSKAVIRGIESQGMICSGKELGISDDGKGILKLSKTSLPGKTFSINSEKVLEITAPQNRPDLLGHLGIAREISALTGRKLIASPARKAIKKGAIPMASLRNIQVRIADKKDCPSYLAFKLDKIKVAPSADFIRRRLETSGFKSINNVVDITNYVMLETGQPLHAFDANKIILPITVRRAAAKETIQTLDLVVRRLTKESLVITDKNGPAAIAGVIGGAHSSVSSDTDSIILEAANFNPITIRKSSRTLNLRTESSHRFEKSIPYEFAMEAALYAVKLLEKHAGAELKGFGSAKIPAPKEVSIDLDPVFVNSLLGTDLKIKEMASSLDKLGFKSTGAKILNVAVPSWRPDVKIWQDLAEEIARSKGINGIKEALPAFVPSDHLSDPLLKFKEDVSEILARAGWIETYNYSFISKQDSNSMAYESGALVEIENPLSEDQQYLRPSLFPNLLKSAEYNLNHGQEGKIFEIGNIFTKKGKRKEERLSLAMVVFGKKIDFGRAFSDLKEIGSQLGVQFKAAQTGLADGNILLNGEDAGKITLLPTSANFKAVGLEIDFIKFSKALKGKSYKPVNRYPSKELDCSIVLDEKTAWAEVLDAIIEKKEALLSNFRLFDVYKGPETGKDKKSFSIKFVYQSPEKTLTDEEATQAHLRIMERLIRKFNAKLRE